MDNADQFGGKKQHKISCQLMFFNELEEEFRQLQQKNGKLTNQNKKIMEKKNIKISTEINEAKEDVKYGKFTFG